MRGAAFIFLLSLSLIHPLMGREFKSADGKSTMEAEFIRYSPETGKVTLRVNNTKNVVSPATAFSEEDQAYFKESQKQVDMQELLEVKIKRDINPMDEDLGEGNVAENRMVEYLFVLKNKSDSTMTGMILEYWVLVQQDVGVDVVKTTTNKIQLEPILPGAEVVIKAPRFPMYKFTLHTNYDKGKKVFTTERERYEIYGARVDLYSSTGQKIFSDRTSVRVEKLMPSRR